jgi:diguanylate cyclase (GGDEF)-like protein
MVARLGGLIVFRDLTRDESWSALEREPEFGLFVQAARRQGLRNVVGISLQAKEQVFGVMILGTSESRSFSAAELRLLLALGHQIGMAVENGWLLQQTTRRTEELNALREVGRVLSSTLDTQRLLETIYSEIRKLFSVDNFYIVFYDAAHEVLHFAFEAVGGVVQPTRSRTAGNYLTEYMLRTRQPVLIREPFDENPGEIASEPDRSFRSFCGVPLVLYNRAIGAMALYHEQERQFDTGHLDVLKILASEAAIALENARLFAEEQKKARHLAVLNNISRRAITTLEPEAMLAEIMQEIGAGLSYDHISIGILDYTAKEICVQAEAGSHRGEMRRRVPIGWGVAGEAARDAKIVVAEKTTAGENRTLLPHAGSALAAPIAYADQIIGVLNVERRLPGAFSQEEILLFQTLADQLAGALHNAFMFQKAQEQAITDGLTGVKTHRYFMEALQSEWKRSTRTSRCFSLVLLDLDRFKYVNDFYGHLEGDVVLQRIGRILEQNCRRSDVVARYGGDEFVILMPETPADQARALAVKLRAWTVADPLLREKNITASFGLATFPMHGSTPQELIQVADASMYVAKHQGGNTVSTTDQPHFDPAHRWNKDVVEAYLGVTLKRLFATGPEAFDEVYERLEKFMEGLPDDNGSHGVPGAVIDTITSLAFAIDAKDHYTQGHSQKVAEYAVRLGRMLGLSDKEVEEIRLAGFVHDIGKVGIPERILHKPAKLDPEEWEVMKNHAYLGSKILEPLRGITRIQEMVKHHHEFVDGSGYPDQLRGTEIPLGARILAIADAYDTMTSDRTYRPARTADQGLAELERCAGTQFDAHLVKLFTQTMRSPAADEVPAAAPASKEQIQ